MTNRLQLLGSVDPYTGRYFSQKWIQQNVLRLTDDEIVAMDQEIAQEKKDGLGLPVGVMNDIAQQSMMAQVPQQPGNPGDQAHAMELQQAQLDHEAELAKKAAKQATKEDTSSTLLKLKRIL